VSLYLAFDTATERGSVAVGEPGLLRSEIVVGARRHAGSLIPAADEALRLAGASLEDVTGLIVADGPGSFTGLRIGFATVQGIARQRPDLDVMTASSLAGAAWLASRFSRGNVAVLYDALRGDAYVAIYSFDAGPLQAVLPPTLLSLERLGESLGPVALAVTDGSPACNEGVRRWIGQEPAGPPAAGPRASGLIELAAIPGALRVLEDVTAWEPDYGREAEAQVRWERTHGKPLPGSVSDVR
jgi:tRNA threonylcarbamoyladenosine biosynthesis protein TsaB